MNNLDITNGTLEDVLAKKNNIWLGISTSLKPYNEELAVNYVNFIAENSKEHGLVFIGDAISAINYHHLDGKSWNAAQKKAKEVGDVYFDTFKRLTKDTDNVSVKRWNDVWNDDYENKFELVQEFYSQDEVFATRIQKPIRSYLQSKERTITDERVDNLSEYVLRELPFLIDGVKTKEHEYKTLLYPGYGTTSMLSKLSYDIQNTPRYEKLRESLGASGDHVLLDTYIT